MSESEFPDKACGEGPTADGHGVHTLFPQAYGRLRGLAAAFIRAEQSKRLLQATALVHEAFMRLSESERTYQNEGEFLSIAAAQMRRVLVDYARKENAAKRGNGRPPLTLDARALGVLARAPFELVDVDDALVRLTELDTRQGKIAELHLFGAMSIDEAALLLGISSRTAFNDWRAGRAWLLKELSP
ncbi:MAG: RNA polymerase subunit sigma-70 [Phycisphaerae bacterium]|jgi:RNA polymerase sigma factor (TIGR02999 family)|nr:RNA polymerase subunit sigma-70 [Phycisphaerae bacterium]